MPTAAGARPSQNCARLTKTAAPTDRTADEQAIRKIIDAFTKSYNEGDAKSLALMFTVDGEIVEQNGDTTHGREAIEQLFATEFEAIEIENGRCRRVDPFPRVRHRLSRKV